MHGGNQQSCQVILTHCPVSATHTQVLLKVGQLLQSTNKPSLLLKVDTEPLVHRVELVAELNRYGYVRDGMWSWFMHTIEKARISSLFGAILLPERPSNNWNKSLATLELSCKGNMEHGNVPGEWDWGGGGGHTSHSSLKLANILSTSATLRTPWKWSSSRNPL